MQKSSMYEKAINELESTVVVVRDSTENVLAEGKLRYVANPALPPTVLELALDFSPSVGTGVATQADLVQSSGKTQRVKVTPIGVTVPGFLQLPSVWFVTGATAPQALLRIQVAENAPIPSDGGLEAAIPDMQCHGKGVVYRKIKPDHCYQCGGVLVYRGKVTVYGTEAQCHQCQDCRGKEFVKC